MQITSRFTEALHILVCASYFDDQKVTSEFLASSIGCNPVSVRQILQKLSRAGLIRIARGTGGITLLRGIREITFLDVFEAVEAVDEKGLFHFHENPSPDCPVGSKIHGLLDERLGKIELAMKNEMKNQTVYDLMEELKNVSK